MLDLQKRTGVINPRLHSRPQLRADCKKYREAYRILTNAREFNQVGLQPIQVSEVLAYVEMAEIQKGYPALKLTRLVQAMDATHLEWWSKKQK